jgi:hypothetical protein
MTQPSKTPSDWKSQSFILGGLLGALFGLLAAYLYNRAAEDDMLQHGGQRNRVSTGDVIGLGLAGLAMIRQISELGRSDAKKR